MKTNLTSLIVSKMSDFSKGQKRIAQYIIEHSDEAAFMTAFKLGETVGVSESTVVRFAAELGFDGYPELQKAIRELIRSKLNSIQRIEVTKSRMADDEVLDHILSNDMANLKLTLEELPRDTFYEAVEAIIKAKKVYIFGAGSCRSLANFVAYYLKMLHRDVHLVYTSSEMEILEEMFHISENDVLIGLSFPRYSSKAVKTLHFAHSRQAKIVAITDSSLSPIASYADYLLLAHSDMATIVDSLV
ncbi:MAG: MurR/RpiR family transcriptional regulator, partial [Clostridia bacterium]|nr:MurR/RpiR family transcriptional regulator [Clostridia bacterium]